MTRENGIIKLLDEELAMADKCYKGSSTVDVLQLRASHVRVRKDFANNQVIGIVDAC